MIRSVVRTLVISLLSSVLFANTHQLYFEPLTSGGFVFTSNGRRIAITADGAALQGVRMKLRGADLNAKAEGVDALAGVSNYFTGGENRLNVPHFRSVKFRGVYPGIDVVYYTRGGLLEYDFLVGPGADPSRIDIRFDGDVALDQGGGVLVKGPSAELRLRAPIVYQDGREISAAYRIQRGPLANARGSEAPLANAVVNAAQETSVRIDLGSYDRKQPLTIDPVVEFARYLGGSGRDLAVAVAVDSTGAPIVTGITSSVNLPTRRDSAQEIPGGATDVFVAKFSKFDGSLVWVTYLGGSGTETGASIQLDPAGNIYVAGDTTSANFPTRNAVQANFGGGFSDAYVTKLNAGGSAILYSTYIGSTGDDFGNGLAVDSDGNAYLTGWTMSDTFPMRNAFQTGRAGGGRDTFVTKISASGSNLVYSTYVGGNGDDIATGIAVDASGNAYVTGQTTSSLFPMVNPFQRTNAGDADAFVYKLAPAGNTLIYGTLLGGSALDSGYRIAVDAAGSAILSGFTNSPNFPTRNAYQARHGGGADIFVAKMSPAGDNLLYSTFVGGDADEFGVGSMFVDSIGSAYVTGFTASRNFPSLNGSQQAYGGGAFDAFVFRLAPGGGSLLYSTLIGGRGDDRGHGIAVDAQGGVFVGGGTTSSDLPRAGNTIEQGIGAFDVFLARLSADVNVVAAAVNPATLVFSAPQGGTAGPQTIRLTSSGPALEFTATASAPWLTISPDRGTTPGELRVSVNASALNSGMQQATLIITIPGAVNSPIQIPVSLSVTARPVITALSPANVNAGSPEFALTVTGTGFSQASVVVVNDASVPTSFVSSTQLIATISASIVATPGPRRVAVVNPGVASETSTLNVVGQGPFFSPSNVVSAASQLAGPVAPGEVITVYGSGFGPAMAVSATPAGGDYPTIAGETRVLIDGIAAPILFVREGQVSAVVPFTAANNALIEIEYRGARSSAISVPVVASIPGIFTADSTGTGQVAAANENGTANSAANPASRGSLITFYATGLGLLDPAGIAGRVYTDATLRPAITPAVRIGGLNAEVVSATQAPGQVSGIIQIVARVPAEAPAGAGVPLVLSTGGTNSAQQATIAVGQ